jgi:hypothetical protein
LSGQSDPVANGQKLSNNSKHAGNEQGFAFSGIPDHYETLLPINHATTFQRAGL